MTRPATTADFHEKLATTALFGTGRRPVDLGDAPAGLDAAMAALAATGSPSPGGAERRTDGNRAEPPELLLGAAALAAAHRRAGVTPTTAAPPRPAAEDPARVVPRAAARRLADLLRDVEPELLRQWLAAAAGRGFRAPHAALPVLLDLATGPDGGPSGLRDAVVPLLGTRGRWLAGFRPEWRWAEHAVTGGRPVAPVDDRAWRLGDPAERLAWLTATRAADPARARAALAATWARETGADRATLLGVLADALGPADEDVLETALDDRRQEVRVTAAGLLSRLPSSAFAARMAARARATVGAEEGRLVVRPPRGQDAAAARDLLPATGSGPTAAWVEQVVGATPLAVWDVVLGGPDDAVAAAAAGAPEWRDVVRAGWSRAAVRQGSAAWAGALVVSHAAPAVASGPAAPAGTADVPPVGLLALLDDDERAAVVSWLVSRAPDAATGLPAVLRLCPAPWPEPLWRAVLRRLATAAGHGPPWRAQPLLLLAGLRFPDGADAAVRAVAAGTRDPAWRVLLAGAADTIAVRTRMLEELR